MEKKYYRGHTLEKQLDKLCKYINSLSDGHAHKNYCKRTVDGVYLEGEAFDYEIITKDYKACFDAKEVEGDVWNLQKKDIVQANNLVKCKRAGVNAYFLLLFRNYGLKQIDIDKVVQILETRKNVKVTECSEAEIFKWIESRKQVRKC